MNKFKTFPEITLNESQKFLKNLMIKYIANIQRENSQWAQGNRKEKITFFFKKCINFRISK